MSGVTGTLIGIGVGSSIASAKMQSSAAKKASQTQVAAGDRALAAQTAGYQQARSDFAPWQAQGAGAVGRLGQMAQAPRQTFSANQNQNQPSPPPMQMASLGNPQGMPPQGQQMPPGGPQGPPQGYGGRMFPGAAQGQPGPPQGAPPPQMGAGPQGGMPPPQMGTQMPPAGGQMVRVRAPNGQEASLSQEQAQMAVAKGAQIIG